MYTKHAGSSSHTTPITVMALQKKMAFYYGLSSMVGNPANSFRQEYKVMMKQWIRAVATQWQWTTLYSHQCWTLMNREEKEEAEEEKEKDEKEEEHDNIDFSLICQWIHAVEIEDWELLYSLVLCLRSTIQDSFFQLLSGEAWRRDDVVSDTLSDFVPFDRLDDSWMHSCQPYVD